MPNHIISIGIDLGTTNSSVVINNNNAFEIVKKPGGLEYTPSVFGFDKAKNKIVGLKAYEALNSDSSPDGSKNFKPEVKRIIGTPEKFYFERAGIEMSAEEISSEILKSLLQDVRRKYPAFDTTSAVITIPAAFSTLQCEATKRAGNLAGLNTVVLLQEPIAAAVSYGFSAGLNENWLVYDLGGGTYDVALDSSMDGVLTVLAHNGDNFLGGKNLDWELVDKIVTPELARSFNLQNFRRDNDVHQSKFSKLKFLAEHAKIQLSEYENTTIEVDGIGNDDDGVPISLSVCLTRPQLETLLDPLLVRTIDLCKQTLKESGLPNSAVSKIILVGGPTQIPYISRRLEELLQIPTDASVDPLTVVARGACIFGLSQQIALKSDSDGQPRTGAAYNLKLNYESLTAETEPTVSGIVSGLAPGDYYTLIQSHDGSFVSPTIPLKNGRFFTTVSLQKNTNNLFWIYLFDAANNTIDIAPESFSITHGLSIAGAPLPHSIGVALQKRDFGQTNGMIEVFDRLIEKGTILPAKRTETFRTARTLTRAQHDNPLWIRVGEGESEIPDRNSFVCELGIKGSDLPRDLPQGTEIELLVEINDIRELSVTAYVPDIDLTLNARSTYADENINLDDVQRDLNIQFERAQTLAANCASDQIDRMTTAFSSASSSLQNAHIDEDEKRKAVKQVRDLKKLLDETTQAAELPQLTNSFNKSVDEVSQFISDIDDPNERSKHLLQLYEIKAEGAKAILTKDKKLLAGVNDRLRDLGGRALFSRPETWVYHFRQLTADGNFANKTEANYLISKGEIAIQNGNIEALKDVCNNLYKLLPANTAPATPLPNVSGITR